MHASSTAKLPIIWGSALFWIANVSASGSRDLESCPTNMNRGLDTQRYLWSCKCPSELTTIDEATVGTARGFAVIPLPTPEDDTQGRTQAFLRCTSSHSERLSHLCVTDGSAFEKQAEHIMRDCAHTTLTPEEESMAEPFSFTTDNCTTTFIPIVSQFQTGGVWLCECEQPFKTEFYTYDIVVGRANFTTNASPTTPLDEVSALQNCTAEAGEQLAEVCFNAPGDFGLLALHLLQTCCKRVRVMSDAKFQCEAFVPDNVEKTERGPLPA